MSTEQIVEISTTEGTFDVGKETLVLREVIDETFDGSSYLTFEQSAQQSYYSELPASRMSLSIIP